MKPLTSQRDAARVVLLPLDCSATTLTRLFDVEPQATLSRNRGFEQYLQTAHRQLNIEPTKPTGVEKIRELATFAALGTLRTHFADPFAGTEYEAREPDGSAESRMLRRPLLKHPGLTKFSIQARNYYVATITWLFENKFTPELQAEIAAVLLARDPPDVSSQAPFRTYARVDPEAIHREYSDRAEVTSDSVWIDGEHLSCCCQLLPFYTKFIPSSTDQLPRPHIGNRGLIIPRKVFRLKLAEYAWHAWARLVHFAYNTLSPREHDRLVSKTPHAEDTIFRHFRYNNPAYAPYLASESKNPQREWSNDENTEKPLQIEDKRLLTIVDCIRATPSLSFGTPLSVQTLFDHLQTYFPPPRRPGNDITSQQTLITAVANAESSQIRLSREDQSSQLKCEIPAPPVTPIYPRNNDTRDFWNSYLHLQTNLSNSTVEREWIRESGKNKQVITPILPNQTWQNTHTDYETALNHAQQTAAQAQSTISSIHDVQPLVNPDTELPLTPDELIFLTRIGLAMERKISEYSLTDSMRVLRHRADGSKLNVNENKLTNQDWLERHDEGQQVLYTVPADKRKRLGITNMSNDGYGEKTTSEKSLHRKGIDQTAAWLATKPDVTRVVRYHDLWRLRSTACEQPLEENNLLSTRIDIIGFNGTTPKYIAEVETKSNSAARAHRCIDKLTAFSAVDGIETTLVTPNPTHLWKLMQHLDHPDYFNLDSFPNSNSDNYGRSEWETKLRNEDVLSQFFDQLETYRSLARSSDTLSPDQYQDKIIGNI